MLQAILIAIAISIDSFSVGFAYGVRNIKVPLHSLIILDLISVSLLSIGFFAGNLLTRYFPPAIAELSGAIIIIGIGIWYLIQGWLNHRYPPCELRNPTSIAIISIKSLGIAINVLRDPSKVDCDISGIIDTKEAILLGFALAVDSLAVGVAVSIASISLISLTLILVAIMNLLFLIIGINLGNKLLSNRFRDKTSFIPGCILILLGLLRIFK
ncbi:sporulation membrane protein YtaF [Alkaliphilus peptidifermentans]|uniref:Putative sporulation protein YtaF n=1 Tax=Alkaliphilus peptidifermentans DSM 18978 TaxID=1120976 RepID=A0A1G5J3D7_9FIRM|nr:sporulation membrane protein YtaF [Alkaliphilus peptidifermentans]SCY82866.1 putative sporulation protein YtaF [Alkaliphilus peptidifermentans DSM 18978]